MINAANLTISAANRELCSCVTFELCKGQKAVLSGASGCGKSSLLRALAGLHPIDAGSVKIDGIELSPATLGEIRRRIVFLPQEPVMGAETAREALLLPFCFRQNARLRPGPERIAEVLTLLGLNEDLLRQPAARLSGGEKQRIAIARGLLLGRELLLADEITAALDRAAQDQVIEILSRLPVTMLAVTHDPVFSNAFPLEFRLEDRRLRKERP
ncbi:MAG: ATP-binding cassette domain-containing protein [Victivallaceae bacterium]